MNATITVFINPSCEPCNRLKDWLKEKNISFIEKDIINDEESAKEFKASGGQFTPTTFIETIEDKYEIIGANIGKIERILEIAPE